MNLSTYESIINFIKDKPRNFDSMLAALLDEFPLEREDSVRSILSQEYQRQVKKGFKESHSSGNKRRIYKRYTEAVDKGCEPGILVRLSSEVGSSALTARMVLEERLYEQERNKQEDSKIDEKAVKQKVGKMMRDTTLIEDGLLAYEVWLATLDDHSYGPVAEAIKGSVGEEHEQKIKDILTEMEIPYCDEHVLRGEGYDKTPDIKLEVPLALEGGHVINWIESKALFGDPESHSGYERDQFFPYWNRFGPGLVIYWAGYVKQLDNNRSKGIVLCDHFPSNITRYQPATLGRTEGP